MNKRIFISAALIGLLAITAIPALAPAKADTATSTAADLMASLRAQMNSLLAQIATLQAQLQAINETKKQIQTTQQEIKGTLCLTAQLREGMTGDEIKTLQEILATDSDIYPQGIISGYFGKLTKQALIRFQLKHGVEGVGETGPQTRKILNAFCQSGGYEHGKPILKNLLKKFDSDEKPTATSTMATSTKKVIICHFPSGDEKKGQTLTIGAAALNAHINQGDTLGACAKHEENNHATTTENE